MPEPGGKAVNTEGRIIQDGRDASVDIVKGMAILLVVYAHTWPIFRNFYRLFCLQLFLVASGYCTRGRIESPADWRRYMGRRMRALYIPCAVCNGIYALLGGVFLRLGLYTDNPVFLDMTAGWPVPQKLFPVNGIADILRKFVRVILLTDTTQMGTSTWFLITLLAISLLHATVCLAAHGLEPGKKRAVLGGLFLLMAGAAQFVRLPGTAWTFLRCFCYSYLTFLLGVGIRELNLKFLETPLCAALSFALLAVMAPYYYIDLANVYIPGVLPYLAGVLGGWSMLKFIADRLAPRERLSRVWIYLGRHTIPVICLHVLCFKAVTWLYIRVRGLPAIYLASFHIDFDAGEGWKLLYLAAGLGGSLLLAAAWHSLVRCICQRSVRS